MAYPPLPEYLTLEEAAESLTRRLGHTWTARNVMECAIQRKISIFARIEHAVRLVRVEPMEGETNQIVAEAGSVPRISERAIKALLLAGIADFSEITYPRNINFCGVIAETITTVWTLAPGEMAPAIRIENCRVTRDAVLELIKRLANSSVKDDESVLLTWEKIDAISQQSHNFRQDKAYKEKYARAWKLYEELDKWERMDHQNDPDKAEKIEARLTRIHAELEEITTIPQPSIDSPPGPPTRPNDRSLSKRERQIRAIEAAARQSGYDLLSIETGGKLKLRKTCKAAHPDLFGFGDDPFNDAWSAAIKSNPPRLRMADHNKFSGK